MIDDMRVSSKGAGGTIWFHFDDQPLWIYERSADVRDINLFLAKTVHDVAESTRFAQEMWPLMLEGFALVGGVAAALPATLTARIGLEIASITLEEIGEEGERSVDGKPSRTSWEIAISTAHQLGLRRIRAPAARREHRRGAPGP